MRSLHRHKEMSFISVFMVFITMIILGCISFVSLNGYFLSQELESDLEVSVFLNKDITAEKRKPLEEKFKTLPGYASSVFVSKEEAYKKLEKKLTEDGKLANIEELGNPLPDAYTIKFSEAGKIQEATSVLKNFPEIDSVNTNDNVVNNVLAFNKTFTYIIQVALAMMILVMKYIGATNLFIKLPFFLEGILIGLFGSLFAAVFLYYGYETFVTHIKDQLSFFPVYYNKTLTLYLLGGILSLGCVIGALGSSLAIKKHLKV